jgi:hypothetical protein
MRVKYGRIGNDNRRVIRSNISNVSRGAAVMGTGAAVASTVEPAVDISGIHVIRGVFGPLNLSVSVDGAALIPVAAVPATAATRTRMGSASGTAPSSFWTGPINTLIVTTPLLAPDAALLLNYLKIRGGLS